MTTQAQDRPVTLDEQEKTIASYLESHLDFFERHPRLLEKLSVPHRSGDAVSLIERQVERLRQQAARYKGQLDDLILVAKDNDLLVDRLHRLTLSLIDAATFDEVMNTLQDEMHDEFKADTVEIRLFSRTKLEERDTEGEPVPGINQAELTAFQGFFAKRRPLCGRLQQQQLEYLFGPDADDTRSVALIPLQGPDFLGMLAIGSQDQDRFHEGKSTDFLVRLGEVVSRSLQAVSLPGV